MCTRKTRFELFLTFSLFGTNFVQQRWHLLPSVMSDFNLTFVIPLLWILSGNFNCRFGICRKKTTILHEKNCKIRKNTRHEPEGQKSDRSKNWLCLNFKNIYQSIIGLVISLNFSYKIKFQLIHFVPKTDFILAWKCLSDRTTLMRNFEF